LLWQKIEKNTEILPVFGKRVGLGINEGNQMTLLQKNAGKIYNTKKANKAKIRLKLEYRRL
jgi:hypothetical protein